MSEPSGAEWLEQPVRITRDGVYFGEHKLPGIISQDGVTLKAGDRHNFNRLTVEFFVGPVIADDPLVTSTPTGDVTQFAAKTNPYADLKCDGLHPGTWLHKGAMLCALEYGHAGDHTAFVDDSPVPITWPNSKAEATQ